MSGVEALKQVTVLCSHAKWRSLPSEDYDDYGAITTVDVHIRRLKQKLPFPEDAIVSVKSFEYQLKDSD